MHKEIFNWLLATFLLTIVSIADAQQPGKTYRIGHLATGSAPANLEPFRLGMHKLGYREGQNMIIESRFAEGKLDRLPHLAAELAYIKVDVILATSTPAAVAAKHTTKTIPIVFTSVADPTGSDLVTSLSKPEGLFNDECWTVGKT